MTVFEASKTSACKWISVVFFFSFCSFLKIILLFFRSQFHQSVHAYWDFACLGLGMGFSSVFICVNACMWEGGGGFVYVWLRVHTCLSK